MRVNPSRLAAGLALALAAMCSAGCLSQGLQSVSMKHEQIRDVTAFYFDEQDRVAAVEAIALHDGKGPPRPRLVLYDPAVLEQAITERMNNKFVVRDTAGRKCVSLWAPEDSYVVLPESIFKTRYDAKDVPPRLAEMRRVERAQFIRAYVQHPSGEESGLGIVIRRGDEDVFLVAEAMILRDEQDPISPLVAFPTALADVVTSPVQAAVYAYWWAAMHDR